MSVAFNTGGSGYPRSDFMISDAAIPVRVEEAAKADQKEQFSKVLSGIEDSKKTNDSTTSVSANSVEKTDADTSAKSGELGELENIEKFERFDTLLKEITLADGGIDMRKLVKAIADGAISPDEIPQELFTNEMLAELVKLIDNIVPADKDDDLKQSEDPAIMQLTAELVSMMNQTALPEDISDLSEEISALTGKIIGAAEEVRTADQPTVRQSVPEEVPEEAQAAGVLQTVQDQNDVRQVEVIGEAVKFTAEEVPSEQKPQAEAKPVQQTQPEAKQTAVPEAAVQTAEKTGAQSEGQTDRDTSGQSNGAAHIIQTAETTRTKQTAPQEEVQFREEVRSVEVRISEKPEESPQREETRIFADHTAQRSRVVFKSDELEAIKSGGEKTDDAVQTIAQPLSVQTEKPVVFTRQDGAEVTVKPSEVAQQVAGKITERAADIQEGDVEYSVTLDPEDLGRITVRMTKTADGTVSVSIAAENSKTLKIIEDNGSAIQNSLKQNGVQLENWQTVSESRQETQAQDYQGSSKNPYRESENNRRNEDQDGESFAEIIASM